MMFWTGALSAGLTASWFYKSSPSPAGAHRVGFGDAQSDILLAAPRKVGLQPNVLNASPEAGDPPCGSRRAKCSKCGGKRVDVWPNWKERRSSTA